jgi:uncharacterized phage protein (predicted DNA packaging)
MPTVEDFLRYLGYDQTDAMIQKNATSALEDAKAYVQGALGEDAFELLPNNPKLNRLVKVYAKDLYDERGSTSAKAGNAKRDMIHSMELQLRLELARKREEREGVSV